MCVAQECYRQVEAEVVSSSRNKNLHTWERQFSPTLYRDAKEVRANTNTRQLSMETVFEEVFGDEKKKQEPVQGPPFAGGFVHPASVPRY